MRDLYLAIAVNSIASIAIFFLAAYVAGHVKRRTATLLCVLVVALFVAYVWLAFDRLWIARFLPVSNVLILGNAMPLFVAMLAGLAFRLIPGGIARRGCLVALLIILSAYRSFAPAFPVVPEAVGYRWSNDVCIQTSSASCSAAAAATLLKAHGIDATEDEMVRLCLTSVKGTPILGLYRGLKLKTVDTEWDVEVFHTDAAGLQDLNLAPAVLSVRLDPGPNVDPRYERLWGWTPGVAHTVVYFGPGKNAEIEMGDPAVGREKWSATDLHVLWHGDGIRLVKRET